MQQLQRGVRRQVEAVEAGVSSREGLRATPALYAEPPRPRGTAERREAFVRYRRRSRHELNQPETLLVRESGNIPSLLYGHIY